MAPLVPDGVPTHFAQGTTVKFTRSLPEFSPSEGWSYTLYLNGLTQKLTAPGAQFDAAAFICEIDAASTSSLVAGPYRYAERLTNPGTRFVLTGVAADGQGNAVYSFSSYSGPAPYVGMPVTITGFANGGNNVAGVNISALSGSSDGGTFTIPNAGAIDETLAAAASGPPLSYDITGDELVILVEASAADSPAGSFQTFEEKTLAALESAITARTSGSGYSPDIEAYHIAGRSVSKMSLTDLLRLRGMYRAVVWRMQHPGKLSKPRKVVFPAQSEVTNLPPTWQDVTGLSFE